MQEMHMQLSEIKRLEWEELIWISDAMYEPTLQNGGYQAPAKVIAEPAD